MICGLSKEFGEKTREERNDIFLKLLPSPYMHVDFTFGRASGKQGSVMRSVMGCASESHVLYQEKEKKGREGAKGSPAEFYEGTIIHDHEATFQSYGSRHQECLVHVERYLRSSIENEPPEAYFRDSYNLYKRMSADREDDLLFLYDRAIPPTHNSAENAAR